MDGSKRLEGALRGDARGSRWLDWQEPGSAVSARPRVGRPPLSAGPLSASHRQTAPWDSKECRPPAELAAPHGARPPRRHRADRAEHGGGRARAGPGLQRPADRVPCSARASAVGPSPPCSFQSPALKALQEAGVVLVVPAHLVGQAWSACSASAREGSERGYSTDDLRPAQLPGRLRRPRHAGRPAGAPAAGRSPSA